jgi:hypothetical protein
MSESENVVESGAQSAEDKFFGVKTKIGQESQDKDENQMEFDIEVVDDRPPEDQAYPRASESADSDDDADIDDQELDGYSKKVRKRIDKLRFAQHEERRQKEEAERLRDEAVNFAQQQLGHNREMEALIQRGEGALITQVKERAKLAVEKAKSSYRKAYEEGNTDNVVDAQENMVRAQAELHEAEQYERSLPDANQVAQQQAAYQQQQQAAYQQQQQQAAYQQQQQQAAVQQPVELDDKQAAWAEENPWFGDPKEKLMSATAYGLHEQALQDHHMDSTSDEYYDFINTGMRNQFPNYSWSDKGGTGQSATATTRRASATSVVAPSARNNGARSRKVRLSSSQVSLAKRLGLTNDQYARQVEKEKANG